MGKLRNAIQLRKTKDKKIYGVNVDFDLKKLYKQMVNEQRQGKTPELFKELQRWGIENKIDIKSINDLKRLGEHYLQLNGINFNQEVKN